LFVIDDIADSFDYRNKYAIIQYLIEIANGTSLFKQIILTHNFDFFRTVHRRFVHRDDCLMAVRTHDEVKLTKSEGIRNIFVNKWKKEFFKDDRMRIASIPFMRNLIEYTLGTDEPDYETLTSLLHWKPGSPAVTNKTLDDIYNKLFPKSKGTHANPAGVVLDMIQSEASSCLRKR
jgi:hypothetical protein